MTERYKIADLLVDMDTFGRTKVQAEHFRCDEGGEADIVVQSDWQKLKEEQPHLSASDCEHLSSGTYFYRRMVKYDGMMLHSSAVVVDGRAYLFTAPSGTGKSTHTKLWCKEFADRGAFILNDDKPAIRLMEDGVFYAYGTPWCGKDHYSPSTRAPLAGICILHRGEENRIRPCGGREAVFPIMAQTVRPSGELGTRKLLDLLDKLLAEVPVWHLECNMEPEAAHVSYNAMSAKGRNE